jgi:hypothetical protein
MTTTRDEILRLIDELDEPALDDLLDYLRWLLEPEDDPLTPEEQARVEAGKAKIARGDYTTLEELRHKLDL